MNKNLLSILDFNDNIEDIIDLGLSLKNNFYNGKKKKYLEDKILALIFERESIRTRVSFEVAMNLLGGKAIFLNNNDLGIGHRESPADVAKVLSRYVDAIVYRAVDKNNLHELAAHATVPVINGLDCDEHPCQIPADLMTIKEKKGQLRGLTLAFIGDGNDNLVHSYLLGCSLVGINVIIISPRKYWPNSYYINKAREISKRKNCTITITEDLNALKNADIVVTDTWISFWDEKDREQRVSDFKNFTVNEQVMNLAKPDAIFMHCMPIHYNEEVVKDVAHGQKSVIIDEAENRLWIHMAILIILLNNN